MVKNTRLGKSSWFAIGMVALYIPTMVGARWLEAHRERQTDIAIAQEIIKRTTKEATLQVERLMAQTEPGFDQAAQPSVTPEDIKSDDPTEHWTAEQRARLIHSQAYVLRIVALRDDISINDKADAAARAASLDRLATIYEVGKDRSVLQGQADKTLKTLSATATYTDLNEAG